MASSLISLEAVRKQVETGQDDDSLQSLIDSVDEDIIRGFGAHDGERTEVIRFDMLTFLLFLPRPADTIASITQRFLSESTNRTVDSDDYLIENEGRSIRHLKDYWQQVVNVTYTPVDETDRRRQVLVDVVKAEVNYPGVDSYQVGDYRQSGPNLARERRRIMARLRQNYGGAGLLA